MFGFLRPRRPLAEAFFERYRQRSLIVHRGFQPQWLERLLELPGGGGYLRLDVRRRPDKRPTPVEWVVHEHLLALELPLPFLVKVEGRELLLRHLTRAGRSIDPSEIAWILDEIGSRHHVRLRWSGAAFEVERGIALDDNAIDYDVSL